VSLSTTAANDRQHRTEMASGQLPEFINKDEIQVRLTRGYSMSGVRSGTAFRRNRSRLLKASHLRLRCAKPGGEQFEHIKWLSNVRQTVHCVVSVTLLAVFQCKRFLARKNR